MIVVKTMIYIYTSDKNEGPTIAFRFKGKKGFAWIDASCRVYSSWSDFKENNKLPKCKVAYPRNGIFEVDQSGDVLIDFGESPACSVATAVLKSTDVTAGIAGIGSMAVGVVGLFFPLTAPLALGSMIVGGASGLYGAGRSTHQIIDRSQHEESISLADKEARLHWLNIVTAPLCVGGGVATMATKHLAASGQVISKTAQVLVDCTIISSFSMSTINIVNNFVNLVDKAKNEELSVLDVSSFVISVAFWTNSAMNLQTAKGIITTTQRDVLKSYSEGLNGKENRQFKLMTKNTVDETVPRDTANPMRRNMHDNAKVIRSMRQINDPKDFFQKSIVANKQVTKENRVYGNDQANQNLNKLRLSLDDYNCMNINNQLKISPQRYVQLTVDEQKTILQATVKFINDQNQVTFLNTVKNVRGIKFELQRDQSIASFSRLLNTRDLPNYSISGKKPFGNLKPHEKDRVTQILNTLSQFDETQQRIATEFAHQMKPANMSEYSSYVEYALADMRIQMKGVNLADRPQNQSVRNFRSQRINSNYFESNGKPVQSGFNTLKERFLQGLRNCQEVNTLDPPFSSNHAAVYHGLKHGVLDFNISSEEYFNKIQSVIDNAQIESVSYAQHGNSQITCYIHEGYKVLVIINDDNQQYTMTMFKH